jgi:amino acid transporter
MADTGIDSAEVASFGYKPTLMRSMGPFSSFGVAFSAVSITGTVALTLPYILLTAGTDGLWTLFGSFFGGMALALVFSDLVGRMPLAGYGYQWTTRLVNVSFGWFVATGGIVAFFLGTSLGFYGFAPFFLTEFGLSVNKTSQILAAVVLLVIVVVINLVGIKLTAHVNNIAVITEIVGGVVLSIAVLINAIIYHPHAFSWLVQKPIGDHGSLVIPVLLGFYYGAFMFVAWEAAADLAEETHDAPRNAARGMLWTIAIVAVGGIIMSFAYTYASPSISGMLHAPAALIYVINYQWGATAGKVIDIVFLISFLSVLMITTAAASRLFFSLARDNMLPGSNFLKRTSKKNGAPIGAILVVAVLMLLFTVLPPILLNSNIIGYFLSASGFGYHEVYILVLVAYLYKSYTGSLPKPLPGAIIMGKWGRLIAWAALAYELFVLGVISLPADSRDGAVTALGIVAFAAIWYALFLYRKIKANKVGPPAEISTAFAGGADMDVDSND